MADSQRKKQGAGSLKQQPSRLQRRAPSSLQVNRSSDWNVAIPLLSPLTTSPKSVDLSPAMERQEARQLDQTKQSQQPCHQIAKPEKVVFKTWQHPAAPFCYEPASFVPPFSPYV